ncbi:thioredoxin [Mycoplasmopsis canis UFG4]|uniref:Thioredoxin n=2 Tax=Mycoplasmopsis canis TaxID=29555 RepID=I1A4N4_9BACT|nr:thioredoxin family protein [Mycoplasmopsis canis]AKF41348.1 thioredoxin [Mycoplasmopsis canis]AMD81464.1 thioredoxin [Mycoplasmopsis canis PG 14]EIE39364.1 thioredoxin [Mycoplasmopsis canis UF33]EIE39515.1 thioredoxin [Mycoplasmopsis canis PG 14]EIE39669.1 thioredoxin [Mycoplasmopsis canis UF31]
MFKKMAWKDAENYINNTNKNDLTFITFTTEWCGDCKMMKRTFDNVASKFKNNSEINFITVDAEEANLFRNPDTKWKVLKVPTMMLLEGEEIIEKAFEYVPEEVLVNWVEKKVL